MQLLVILRFFGLYSFPNNITLSSRPICVDSSNEDFSGYTSQQSKLALSYLGFYVS